MIDILITNAKLEGKIVDISITDQRIESIGKLANKDAKIALDAQENIVIPGFVDSHTHLDKCLLNELKPYQDVTGPEKGKLTVELKEQFTVEDIINRAERMLKSAIQNGTLYVRTNVDVDESVGTKGVEALLHLKKKYEDQINVQVVAFAQEGVFADNKTQDLLRESLQMGADLVGGHTIAKGEGKPHIDFILSLAKEFDVEADFHLDESGNREHYLLPYLCEKMIEMDLGGRVNGIHCCTLSALNEEELEEALDYIKKAQLKVTVAPTAISTRNIAPVKEVLKTNVTMGLGNDNIRDFFNPLGNGDVRHVALLLSYLQRFFTKEENEAIVHMITKGGAEHLGFKDYGIKEQGSADITILNAKNNYELIANQHKPMTIIRKGKIIHNNIES